MLLSSSALSEDSTLECDVCIIGSGPAGISLALELPKTIQTVVLEAGGTEVSADSQNCYRGRASGPLISDQYLSTSRLRCFGGTSGHWAGWCLPLESIDVEGLPWLEHTKWPLDYSELWSYYSRASEYVEVPPFRREKEARLYPEPFANSSDFYSRLFHVSPPTRFAKRYRSEINERDSIQLYTGLFASELVLENDSIVGIRVKKAEGGAALVRAKQYVLACGGIENARWLLNTLPESLVKALPWLGKGFSDHAEYSVGIGVIPSEKVTLRRSVLTTELLENISTIEMYFPHYRLLESERLPNFAVQLTPISPERCPEVVREMGTLRSELLNSVMQFVHVRIRTAPLVRRENGIVLGNQRDSFGHLLPTLYWNIAEDELLYLKNITAIVAQALTERHAGATFLLHNSNDPFQHAQYASHHMATTRMARTATEGVVDMHGKLFGLDNCYVAGSSVFSSCGVANPTLTILALSIRLARHLEALHT